MHRILLVIVIFLSYSAIQLSAQPFSAKEWEKVSLNILNLMSDNERLKKEAIQDSIANHKLTVAYHYKSQQSTQDSIALTEARSALSLDQGIIDEKDKQITTLSKGDKTLKVVCFGSGVAGIVGIALGATGVGIVAVIPAVYLLAKPKVKAQSP